MSHNLKTDGDLRPIESKPVELPKIYITHVTSTGDKGIKNHQHAISEFEGSGPHQKIEKAVLLDMKNQADRLSSLIDYRLEEL